MKKQTVLCRGILLIALVLCFAVTTTVAQDMAKVAPANVKLLLENNKVRVLDVQAKPGDKLPMHSHPGYILYPLSNAKIKTTSADGKVVDVEFKAGEARWSEKVTHANEAVTDVHVLVIEVKEHPMMKKK